MRCLSVAALCAAVLAASEATSSRMHLRAIAKAKAAQAGSLIGENKAASTFFKEWMVALPKNLTKAKQDAVVATLEAEVGKLGKNVQMLKAIAKNETAHAKDVAQLKAKLGGKDKAMLDSMDAWSSRMNEKARIGGLGVISKLKNAIHLIKKGALSGNGKAAIGLNDLLKQMGDLAR
mmetsp:Transcript_91225/g.295066  ORF Transcript_91225/g.295066 Transcript_91225/m.295066 type:complete len:177 (-) Transcript_91225:84-614(-)